MTIENVCRNFQIEGEYKFSTEIKSGLINKTYKVVFFRDGEDKPYILQRINSKVFKNPEMIMKNIVAVTEHIRAKIKATGISAKRLVLHYCFTSSGDSLVVDPDGYSWRAYRFIDDSIVYDGTGDLELITETGRAFGSFQRQLDDFDADSLFESIPDFHNTKKRYEALKQAVESDVCGRYSSVKEEVDALFGFYDKATYLIDLSEKGLIPHRVTHNDTKCNNVCFDNKTGKALAVLDLDTVMPGLCAYDFGDAVRFTCNEVSEDAKDISKVSLNIDKYKAFAKGFLGATKDSLTELEIDTLAQGALAVTTELSIRFLTDYLCGDVYFAPEYPEHNLVRARNQLALAKDIDSKMGLLQDIVKEYAR